MVSQQLVYQATERGWELQKQLPDGTFTNPTPAEHAMAHALQVARASGDLRRTIEYVFNQYGGTNFWEHDLPKVLDSAGQLHGALCGLQECLTDSELRKRLGATHAEIVNYAGEAAPSYVEAIFRAGEKQYTTINMLCRHGVLYDYLSRLHPSQADKLGEPWPELPGAVDIEWNANNAGCLRTFKTLLAGICQTLLAMPEVDSEIGTPQALQFLEKELTAMLPATVTATLFVPNDFQGKILNALNGRALKKQPLADEVCAGEGTRLYRSGGIKELKAAGKVEHKNRLGYYRPDAPPTSP